MKKRTVQFLGLIEVLILLGALALFILSNPNSLTMFINYTTKELGISYNKVSGNLLQTVTLKDIRYLDKPLAKEASINWNIKALFTASIKIDEIIIKDLNIPLTKKWINDLNHKFATKDKTKIKSIPTIEISEVVFSALPFDDGNISVQRIELQANNIKGNLQHIDIGSLSFLTQNNYADITAIAKLQKGVLSFEKLWLEKIDVKKVIKLIDTFKQNDTNKTQNTKSRQTFIKKIKADEIIVNILPLSGGHYFIKNSTITCKQLVSDLKNIDAKHIYIDTSTNIWTFSSDGKIKKNKLYTNAKIDVNETYFKRFVPFFDFKKLNPFTLQMEVDSKELKANIQAKTDSLLIRKYKKYGVSIPKIKAFAQFDFQFLKLDGEINATLKSNYTKDIALNSRIYYHDGFTYDGIARIPQTKALPKLVEKLLKQAQITFYGNTNKITAYLKTPLIKAKYDGANYKKEYLHVSIPSVTPTLFDQNLTKNFNKIKGKFDANIPIDFNHILPLNIDYSLISNALDINGSAKYKKAFNTKANISLSKNTIIKELLPKLKAKALFPMNINLSYTKNQASIQTKAKWINTNISYELKSSACDAVVNLNDQTLNLKGMIDKKFSIYLNSPSLRELQDNFAHIYQFKKLPLDGALFLKTTISDKSKIDTAIKSKWLVYEYKPNHFAFAEKVRLNVSYEKNRLTLHNYYFSTYLDRDRIFFANRPSSANIKNKQIKIVHLWINDALSIKGKYNLSKGLGTLKAFAKNYHYNDLEGNFYFDTKLTMLLQKHLTKVEGFLQLNKGVITYEHRKEHYVQDEDIIIIQKQKKHQEQSKNNIAVDISIKTKTPITYKIPNTKVKIESDLKLWKEPKQKLELLGILRVPKGIHTEGDKEFEIEPSEILFSGPILNPYLNIRAFHESDPYKIYININGQLDAPLINFSSTPYLTQSDILSILLFNSTTNELVSGSQDRSKTAISMFGNAFAKEIVQNFGIKLDKLVLSTTQEGKLGIEVGKKLSKKITLIYINDIVQTIKVRYKMSDHFESDFVFSPDNSGVDIIYKDEY